MLTADGNISFSPNADKNVPSQIPGRTIKKKKVWTETINIQPDYFNWIIIFFMSVRHNYMILLILYSQKQTNVLRTMGLPLIHTIF